MARLPSLQTIDFLVSYRFELENLFLPKLPNGRDRRTLDELSSAERAQIEAYRDELSQKGENEIADLLAGVRKEIEEEREKRHPLNTGKALATTETYAFWSKAAFWTDEEATALMIGRNPDVVTEDFVLHTKDKCATAESYKSLRMLTKRAFGLQGYRTAKPSRFIAWARDTKINIPEELLEAVQPELPSAQELLVENRQLREKLSELESRTTPAAGKPLHTRERESLLKIVLAVAKKKYHFDPAKAKNAAASNIANTVHEIGFRMDEDTVRKFLNEAKALECGED